MFFPRVFGRSDVFFYVFFSVVGRFSPLYGAPLAYCFEVAQFGNTPSCLPLCVLAHVACSFNMLCFHYFCLSLSRFFFLVCLDVFLFFVFFLPNSHCFL